MPTASPYCDIAVPSSSTDIELTATPKKSDPLQPRKLTILIGRLFGTLSCLPR